MATTVTTVSEAARTTIEAATELAELAARFRRELTTLGDLDAHRTTLERDVARLEAERAAVLTVLETRDRVAAELAGLNQEYARVQEQVAEVQTHLASLREALR